MLKMLPRGQRPQFLLYIGVGSITGCVLQKSDDPRPGTGGGTS